MTPPDDDPSDEYAARVLAEDAIKGLLDFAEGRVLSEEELDERLNELRNRVGDDTPAAPSE
jgi:hypothetical protein